HTKDIEYLKGFLDKLFDDVNPSNGTKETGEELELTPCTEGEDINTYKAKVDALSQKLQSTNIKLIDLSGGDATDTVNSAKEALKKISDKMTKISSDLTNCQTALTNATNHLNTKNEELRSARESQANYQNQIAAINNELTNMEANSSKTKADLERWKIDADAALKQATAELDQLLLDVSTELNLGSQSDAIAAKREEIARLQEKAEGATVKAPVAGTVISVNITAGETTQPEAALATLQPEGKGYTLSFSVTNDQARTVKVGEQAEIQNSWYYSEVEAVLAAIRPDTAEPGQKKLLQFSVTGDVSQGQSLSLTVGQKTADYDMLVPNNAVREDNNGKFILIIETKDSPLGNRYIATRVDVEVLGSDDTKTAISAPLYGYEYVITTSTKPVEAGKQVRLTENQ
ncbi:MAG: HlyD family efflux transporter periplasmic adaptor subunit, partial [Lachnospiraceae bacterium]|nr:HlyD family efflux transporter periplasmic adaptor subunit [Lachnospiraceae bacterium]